MQILLYLLRKIEVSTMEMELLSVSKGTFAFAQKPVIRGQAEIRQIKNHSRIKNYTDTHLSHESQPWYTAFKHNWLGIENILNEVDASVYSKLLFDLKEFIHKASENASTIQEIPTGIVMSGVNLPDRNLLFEKIKSQLEIVTPHVAIMWSRDAVNLHSLTQKLISQIINSRTTDIGCGSSKLSNIRCTFHALLTWCKVNNKRQFPVVIVLPDFECFTSKVIHDLILILSLYTGEIKFILIFGVATTLHVVHQSLSYDALSKLIIKVFRSKRPIQILSEVLELVLLSPNIPFKLVGQALQVLIDVFLLYDFSVNGFFQNYKICMWTHFYNKNDRSICCKPDELRDRVSSLTSKDTNALRNEGFLESFEDCLGSEDDDEIKELVIKCADDFHTYMSNFLMTLKCLHRFTIDLVGPPFGKTFREIYAKAVNETSIFETAVYKQAIILINCLSREDLLKNIEAVISILEGSGRAARKISKKLREHMISIKNASTQNFESFEDDVMLTGRRPSRSSWNKNLQLRTLKLSSSPYKEAVNAFVRYLDEKVFRKYLISPNNIPLNEVFCYWNVDTVIENIRGPLHKDVLTALNHPHWYLDCECCDPEDDEILPTYPDISIVYKLHLESRKMINLYDLLQSYLSIVVPENSDEQDVDFQLYARFTRAIAELQLLGFVKNTRRKTDHVKRLT